MKFANIVAYLRIIRKSSLEPIVVAGSSFNLRNS